MTGERILFLAVAGKLKEMVMVGHEHARDSRLSRLQQERIGGRWLTDGIGQDEELKYTTYYYYYYYCYYY